VVGNGALVLSGPGFKTRVVSTREVIVKKEDLETLELGRFMQQSYAGHHIPDAGHHIPEFHVGNWEQVVH
jgi:hypothetical protein